MNKPFISSSLIAKHSIPSICPYCGVGCGINLQVENNTLIGVSPQSNHPISHGQLCAKGWSTVYGVESRDSIDNGGRIIRPLMKVDNRFQEVSWKQAIDSISQRLSSIIEASGADSVGIVSSARATNEDNYAAQKLARAVFKTNNVDHCARICHSPTVVGLNMTLGSGAMTNSVDDVSKADVIMVIGADPTENHSVIGGQVMLAKLRGAKLIVVDPRRTRLAKMADIHLQLTSGSNIALLNAMVSEIIKHQWQDQDFVDSRCDGFEELAKSVCGAMNRVRQETGLDPEKVTEAARIYSQAKSSMIMYGMGITQFMSGTFNVVALSNLALICGQIGRPGTGINPLRGQNNVQGACDMGCLPNVYPGYQAVDNPSVHQRFSNAWGTELSPKKGLTSLSMSRASLEGDFHALILFGEDPLVTDPDQNQVRRGLEKLDLLVVAELTLTETAKMADFVLPAATFAEKEGTFTNCERRVQLLQQALWPLGEAKADWQWIADIAKAMGSDQLNWPDTEAVFDEMVSVTPGYSGMTYSLIKQNYGLQWPCNEEHPKGTHILHKSSFPTENGKAKLMEVNSISIDEPVDKDFPLLLTTNRLHFHYGCGSMTRKSPLLERETPAGILFINPLDAQLLGIDHLVPIGVRSRRGYLETRAVCSEDLPQGLVSMPYHFREAPSNQLTNTAQDPMTKMPELKVCAVSVVPLPKGQEPRDIDTLHAEGVI